MFRRILIANRGEIALRVIRTAREMGIETVAVYSDVDRRALHTRMAHLALPLGGSLPRESYLDMEKVIAAARASEAEAIHPGYGFLSENAVFARKVRDAGLAWIGPPPEAIEAMGDKIKSRRHMKAAGVPVVPGLVDPVADASEAAKAAKEIGYPIVIKAAAGGGGKGIRVVRAGERARGRVPHRVGRGVELVRRRPLVPRALSRRAAPRRGAGALRPPRQRRALRRARVLDPAPPPEADRGVPVGRRRRPSCARRWARSRCAPVARSATRTRARSSSCIRRASSSSSR